MKKSFKILLIIIINILLLRVSQADILQNTQGCPTAGVSASDGAEFIKNLQNAIKKDNKDYISSVINYPLLVNENNKGSIRHYNINTKKEFLKKYNIIFNDVIKNDILLKNPNNIICTYQGAALEDGSIWFSRGNVIQIISINI